MVIGTITKAASVVTAVGIILGGGYTIETRYAPMSIVHELEFSNITNLMDLVKELGSTPEGCEALDQAIMNFCHRNAGHYLCRPDTIRDIKGKAGCVD